MASHILVGYDGSASAHRAFQKALRMARNEHGRIRVVTALRTTEAGSETCAMMMTDASARRAREMLDALRPEAGDMADKIDMELIYGSPGDVLLSQARLHGIDHIVIGHTGHGALARWLLGSVSHDVLSGAQVPVTVVD